MTVFFGLIFMTKRDIDASQPTSKPQKKNDFLFDFLVAADKLF